MAEEKCFAKDTKLLRMIIKYGIVMTDMANVEKEQLAKKIKEVVSNTRPKNCNMKREKESVQNSAFSKEEKWFTILLKVEYFECFQRSKKPEDSNQSFSPGFCGKTLKSESLVEILLEDTRS